MNLIFYFCLPDLSFLAYCSLPSLDLFLGCPGPPRAIYGPCFSFEYTPRTDLEVLVLINFSSILYDFLFFTYFPFLIWICLYEFDLFTLRWPFFFIEMCSCSFTRSPRRGIICWIIVPLLFDIRLTHRCRLPCPPSLGTAGRPWPPTIFLPVS